MAATMRRRSARVAVEALEADGSFAGACALTFTVERAVRTSDPLELSVMVSVESSQNLRSEGVHVVVRSIAARQFPQGEGLFLGIEPAVVVVVVSM